MTTTRRPAARRYPRDVTAGTRLLVRMATSRGPRPRPGTVQSIEQDGNRYRVVVTLDSGDTVRIYPAANAKLDLAPRSV
jgi:hypothetical protein